MQVNAKTEYIIRVHILNALQHVHNYYPACVSSNHIISMFVCVCASVRACVTGGHGSDSTSGQILPISLGDGDCRPKRGCPVSWHP